jgi:GNAT superfamily N-acetyltransferase
MNVSQEPTPELRESIVIVAGGLADADFLLSLFDEAVAWMTARGQGDQWGTEPWSQDPARVQRVHEMAGELELWIAHFEQAPAGALALSERPPSYVRPASERELYVRLLITSRKCAGHGIGAALLDHARAQASQRSIDLVRVDCWAGAEGRLIDYYVRNGFTPTERFDVKGWPGQILEDRLSKAQHDGL